MPTTNLSVSDFKGSASTHTNGTDTGESPMTTEVESESFGGELEEESKKRRALSKPDDGTKDCTDQNGSKKEPKG